MLDAGPPPANPIPQFLPVGSATVVYDGEKMRDKTYPESRTRLVSRHEAIEFRGILQEVAEAAGLSVEADEDGRQAVCRDADDGSVVCTIRTVENLDFPAGLSAHVEFEGDRLPPDGPVLRMRVPRRNDEAVARAVEAFSGALEHAVVFRPRFSAATVRTMSTIVAMNMRDVLGRIDEVPVEDRDIVLAEYEDVVAALVASGVAGLDPGLSAIDEWRVIVAEAETEPTP